MAVAGVSLPVAEKVLTARFCEGTSCAVDYLMSGGGREQKVWDPEDGVFLTWEEASDFYGFCAHCTEWLAYKREVDRS